LRSINPGPPPGLGTAHLRSLVSKAGILALLLLILYSRIAAVFASNMINTFFCIGILSSDMHYSKLFQSLY
jgi:hypothetical protein